ncbi:MAG: Crp/Fnr family transcriptional regulator [Planctomycetota bacterium]|nr:MAG: Crp/Fnr family transcriptional regulator [Planctomycetota bacterium]
MYKNAQIVTRKSGGRRGVNTMSREPDSSANEGVTARLQRATFLGELSAEDAEKLAALACVENHAAGATVFEQGEVRDSVYVVSSGLVALEVCLPRRGCVRIQTLGAGDLLGWSALLSDGCMTARAVAVTPTVLVAFPAAELRRLCDEDHDIGYVVMRQAAVALSRRLLATRLQLLDVFGETEPVPAPPHAEHR